MKPVKSSHEEKEVPKKWTSVFIANEIGSFNYIYGLWDFVDRILSIEHNFMPISGFSRKKVSYEDFVKQAYKS